MNRWITGNYEEVETPSDATLVIADPVYGTDMVRELWSRFTVAENLPTLMFCAVDDLFQLAENPPKQILHWVKPVSTKNTVKKYSSFVEVICVSEGVEMTNKAHWSCRTGVFVDQIIDPTHVWKKPESLVEKLLVNHYKDGSVFDPCAGSGTVHNICKKMGVPSLSVEIREDLSKNAEIKIHNSAQ